MSIPASRAAASTASRSSTTSPKWRVASGPCVRPSASARNWSPMSTNAMPGDPAAQLQVEQAPVEVERLVDRADLECDVVDPDGAGHRSRGRPRWLSFRVVIRLRMRSCAQCSEFSAARSASVCSTFSEICGESCRRRRKPDSWTTSTRTGLVAVTVAFRGRCETSAISPKKAPGPRSVELAPLGADVDVPSTRRKNSWPCRPSSISFVPAGQAQLVRERRDLAQLLLAAAREQRHLAAAVRASRPCASARADPNFRCRSSKRMKWCEFGGFGS